MGLRTEDVLPPGFRLHWYQLQSVLGDGGFGITYLGRDTNLNQSVAIKEYFPKNHVYRGPDQRVMPSNGSDNRFVSWGMRRFLDEARLLARFRHPNIVRVLSVFESLGTAFMVMELERGSSLGEVIKADTISADEQVLDICIPLLDGLKLVHEAGFIHRDIKPCNILLRPGLGPVLIDFGSARQPLSMNSSSLTAIVSRGYAPFEQYDAGNEQRQGPWTDIYGLAATLYHVITGAPVTDALARGLCLLNGDPDPMVPCRECAPGRFSARLLEAVDRGLAFSAKDRPQTVAEWRELFPAHCGPKRANTQVRTEALDPQSQTRAVVERWRQSHDGDRTGRAAPVTCAELEGSESSTLANPLVPDTEYLRRRMLVVDADRTARSFTCRVLANLGASQVDEADGVEAALARLEDAQAVPEVLLCDLRMEPVDGIQFIRHLGERGVRASLLLTADTDEHLLNAAQHLARIQGLTVLGGVRKPVTPATLSAVLARLDLVAPPGAEEVRERAQGTGLTIDSLRAGITGGAMELEYLPMVSLRERELLGAEALVRWRDAEGRTLDAATLVQEVEAAGLGDAFTERVLHMALSQAGAWHASGLPCGVSVNMFASSLGRLDLPEYLMDVSGQEGVTPGDVTLEVNELRFQRHREVPLEVLTRLRLRGVGVALDDFGTGSLGLDRLRHIPFTALKVDRDFVATAIRDRTSRAILESSVSLARRLGMRAVAEGVVDAVTFRLVRDLGFDAAQGYGICPPIPGDRLAEWSRDGIIGRTGGAAQDLLASA